LSGYLEELELPDFHLWKKTEEKRIPLSAEIEFTERCNNNCIHCYINLPANDEEAKKRELSFREITDIVDEAVEMGCLWWLISGGEPLVRKDFADIYLYLKKKGLLVSVFTNATLITPKLIRLFKRYPPRDLEITIYGVTRKTYERITRTPGSFEAFRRGINLL
jgi:MoaA/NifB/PqqE/SkfB family radical SAM enzyme